MGRQVEGALKVLEVVVGMESKRELLKQPAKSEQTASKPVSEMNKISGEQNVIQPKHQLI
jgi:hypothetical protein